MEIDSQQIDPEEITLNKQIINDVSKHPVLWDPNHQYHNVESAKNIVWCMLGAKYNMTGRDFCAKWKRLKIDYQKELIDHRLSLQDDEIPATENYGGNYQYFHEMKFLNRFLTHLKDTKSAKRRRSVDDDGNNSKRYMYSDVPMEYSEDTEDKDTSSQSFSPEIRPASRQNIDTQNSSQSKAQVGNVDRVTQTPSSSNVKQSYEDRKVFERFLPHQRNRLSKDYKDLLNSLNFSFGSTDDSLSP
ncbi:hypothetical protein WA026_020586 [Henosepilachna vigintioctopunctata]|uniref:MADF domain-containing protein n=1 Tax=Henosepilachna vigintioctopunctata TaxID=420089 RepID=A0AAW1V211_9CUCU